jgi:hypothetical protein
MNKSLCQKLCIHILNSEDLVLEGPLEQEDYDTLLLYQDYGEFKGLSKTSELVVFTPSLHKKIVIKASDCMPYFLMPLLMSSKVVVQAPDILDELEYLRAFGSFVQFKIKSYEPEESLVFELYSQWPSLPRVELATPKIQGYRYIVGSNSPLMGANQPHTLQVYPGRKKLTQVVLYEKETAKISYCEVSNQISPSSKKIDPILVLYILPLLEVKEGSILCDLSPDSLPDLRLFPHIVYSQGILQHVLGIESLE